MEKTNDREQMEKTNVDHRKLMEKTMLDEKIKGFFTKYQSGSIAWYAEQHLKSKSFPEG